MARVWCMRSRLHLVATEDLGWLLGLLGPTGVAAAAPRTPESQSLVTALGRSSTEPLGLDQVAPSRETHAPAQAAGAEQRTLRGLRRELAHQRGGRPRAAVS